MTDKALAYVLETICLLKLQDLEAPPTSFPTNDRRRSSVSSVSSQCVYSGRGGIGNAQTAPSLQQIEEVLKTITDPSKVSGTKKPSFSGRGGVGNFSKKKDENGRSVAGKREKREADVAEHVDKQLKHPEQAHLGPGAQGIFV